MNAQQIKIMLDLQDAMNTKVNANWKQQGYEWYRILQFEHNFNLLGVHGKTLSVGTRVGALLAAPCSIIIGRSKRRP